MTAPHGFTDDDGHVPPRKLTARERRVATELAKLDEKLSDLYKYALFLSTEDARPALAGLAAHAGRELNNGLLWKLAGHVQLTREERQTLESQGTNPEAQAEAMGRALGFSKDDPSIRYWFDLQSELVSAAHFRGMEANGNRARRALSKLTAVLDALVGPHFDAERDLAPTLARVAPTEDDFDAVLSAMGNLQLRAHCFRNFNGAAWLRGLDRRKVFTEPPRARRIDDTSWAPSQWIEGDYLIRVAADAPELVTTILRRTPKDNDNPIVWDVMAKCMAALPVESARGLHRLLAHGISNVPFVIWPEPILAIVARFAQAGDDVSAQRIARSLCALAEASPDGSALLNFGVSLPPTFAKLPTYDAPELVIELARAMVIANPRTALTWAIDLLNATLRRTIHPPRPRTFKSSVERFRALASDFARRISGREVADDEYATNTVWCRRFDDNDHEDDSRTLFARGVAEAAVNLAQRSEEDAQWALAALGRERHPIFRRAWRYALARCSPHAADMVDRWFSSADAAKLEWRSREAGDVLRMRFDSASLNAQQAFADRLRAGPSAAFIRQRMAHTAAHGHPTTAAGERREWTMRWLRRFDANLPRSLHPLAAEIGYAPENRSAQREGLEEDGSYGGPTQIVYETSPIQRPQLDALTDSEIAELLRSWRPDSQSGRDGPSIHGLNLAVTGVIATTPSRGLTIAAEFENDVQSRVLVIVTRGILDAHRELRTVPVQTLLPWLRDTAPLLQALRSEAAEKGDKDETDEAARNCLDILRVSIAAGAAAGEFALLWQTVDAWIAQPLVWSYSRDESTHDNGSLVGRTLSWLQGIATHAVVSIGRHAYNVLIPEGREPSPEEVGAAQTATAIELNPRLDRVLASGGDEPATLAALGQALTVMNALSPNWVDEHRDQLLRMDNRFETSPFWTGYLLRNRLTSQTFADLRAQYVETAQQLESFTRATQWSIPQHFADHMIVAALWGFASRTDEDQLLQIAWERFHTDDMAHAYWATFRSFSDGDEAPRTEVMDRLVDFWTWRLEVIEAAEADPTRRVEEANALAWWCVTPFVSDRTVLSLGARTLALADARNSANNLWERTQEMPDGLAVEMWPLVREAIAAELRGPHVALFAQSIGPTLQKISVHGSPEIRRDVRSTVNDLGRRGFLEFRNFLPPIEGANDGPEPSPPAG